MKSTIIIRSHLAINILMGNYIVAAYCIHHLFTTHNNVAFYIILQLHYYILGLVVFIISVISSSITCFQSTHSFNTPYGLVFLVHLNSWDSAVSPRTKYNSSNK